MGFWSYDSYLGDKRRLDELLEEIKKYEIAVHDRRRDWKECEEYLPILAQEIERLRDRIRKKGTKWKIARKKV